MAEAGTETGQGGNPEYLLAQARAAEEAAARDVRNVPALLRAAEACLRAGLKERAVANAEAAVAASPGNFRALRTLSGILNAAGQRERAIQTGRLAAESDPSNMEVRLHLGGLLLNAGHFREAANHLAVHASSPSATPRSWRMLSSALHKLGRTEQAIDAIERAIALDPNDLEYRLHRVSMLETRGRYGDALEELATASAQAPDDARIHRAASGIHEVLGDLPRALECAERAAGLAPDSQPFAAHRDHVARLIGIASRPAAERESLQAPVAAVTDGKRHSRHLKEAKGAGLAADLRTRWRVIHALMLREMRTRFSQSRLGYFWAVMEPLSHLMTLGWAFSILNHSPPPVGNSLFLYYCTGLLPYLMFSHVASEMMHSVPNSGNLLMLPIVRSTDVMMAKGLMQFSTEIIVGVVVFSAAAVLGQQGMPADLLTCMQAVTALFLLGMGIGSINMVMGHYLQSWETWFASVVRLLYFASGIYYSPIFMPDWARDILVWNPILQGIEWFRTGFYAQYEPHWLDRGYLIAWAAITLVIGLSLERATRKHARITA